MRPAVSKYKRAPGSSHMVIPVVRSPVKLACCKLLDNSLLLKVSLIVIVF